MAAGDITPGARLPDGTGPSELQPGEYAFARHPRTGATALWIRCPTGEHGHVDPGIWDVTVHDDDTVTVAPSIFANAHDDPPGWHGFLERGVWRQV